MKPALLVIDMQNEFFAEGSSSRGSMGFAAEYVNAAIHLFRAAEAPVILISDIEEPDRVPGRAPFEIHPSIAAEAGDLRVDKRFGNAFWQTDLDDKLGALSADMLILCGFCAEFCVLDTFRGARERGYGAAVLRNGIASGHAERIRFVEEICDVVSYGALAGLMGVEE